METLRKAYEDGEFIDLIIVCGDKSWNFHRMVILTKSQRFRNSFIEAVCEELQYIHFLR